jgi:Transposase domain (DUF772)
MAYNFHRGDHNQPFLLPPDLRDWLPADHLAWFILDVAAQLDLQPFLRAYRADGHGHPAYDPKTLLGVLLYAYATGVRSSRQIERRCREDLAFRVLAGNQLPDHVTIARFRRTDIAVQATLIHDPYAATPAAAPDRLVVVVEVKGAWNDGLLSDQRNQLAVRYLPESGSDTGIYVVGWYPVDLWTATGDQRKTKAGRLVREDLERVLAEQAKDITSELARFTHPMVLEVPRPHPATAS